jgi:hypothetical protein
MRKRRLGQVQGCSHTNPELSLGALASNLYKIQCWLPEKVEDLLGSASNHTNHDFTILRWMMQEARARRKNKRYPQQAKKSSSQEETGCLWTLWDWCCTRGQRDETEQTRSPWPLWQGSVA